MKVLDQINEAFAAGYKTIILEAPTGFGKSPVAIALARTLGKSYICTATKNLQTQYTRDFPYLKVAKGANNFTCNVKQDFIRNGTYACKSCNIKQFENPNSRTNFEIDRCWHKSADYGPCRTQETFKKDGCKYKTFVTDYIVLNSAAEDEQVVIDSLAEDNYRYQFSKWFHRQTNIDDDTVEWTPCEYYHQKNIAWVATHSILNYSNFLAFTFIPPDAKTGAPYLPERDLLVLDEGHLLETEVARFKSLVINRRRWQRYLDEQLVIEDHGYDDFDSWIWFLIELEEKMYYRTKTESVAKGMIESLARLRYDCYKWGAEPEPEFNESGTEFEENVENSRSNIIKDDEKLADAERDTEKLTSTIDSILGNRSNWIISNITPDRDNPELGVARLEIKPIDISGYCTAVFEKCARTLIMSATILNHKAFCRSVGLNLESTKFIQVPSDFPIANRPIVPSNVVYLNFKSLAIGDVQLRIAKAVDDIMTKYKNFKGIIHTTSYSQLNFIRGNISADNRRRLIVTDPEVKRDKVIAEHIQSTEKTVLISPSLHLGLDLKDELSRFQIIVKVPYPDKSDRWINAKSDLDPEWYYWQTALNLVQAYGRSIRSKEDWAHTYILDSAFFPFLQKNRTIFPDWFVQAIDK